MDDDIPTLRHACGTEHRTPQAVLRCHFPGHDLPRGNGSYFIVGCNGSIAMFDSVDWARRVRSGYNAPRGGCSPGCSRNHVVERVVLVKLRSARE